MRLSQVGGGPPEEVDRLQRSKKLLPSKFMPLFVQASFTCSWPKVASIGFGQPQRMDKAVFVMTIGLSGLTVLRRAVFRGIPSLVRFRCFCHQASVVQSPWTLVQISRLVSCLVLCLISITTPLLGWCVGGATNRALSLFLFRCCASFSGHLIPPTCNVCGYTFSGL